MLRRDVTRDAPHPPPEPTGLPALPGLVHGFTNRAHGSAAGPDARGPATDAVERADAVTAALGEPAGGWRRHDLRQVHGARTVLVTADRPDAAPVPEADALVTAEPGELLVVRTADCLPVLLVAELFDEPVAVAAVHAGWRGLVAGVLDSALDELARLAPTARLHAALGPAIGPCCFEIGPDAAGPLSEALGAGMLRPGEGDRSFADLPGGARRLLEMREVRVGGPAPACTRCRPDLYHSYRADGERAGRMAAFVGHRLP